MLGPSQTYVAPYAHSFSATDEGLLVVGAATAALEPLESWDVGSIEQALREALVDGMGLKPRVAFGPVRVAVSGRRVSPPLFESLELLGRDRALSRLSAAAGR